MSTSTLRAQLSKMLKVEEGARDLYKGYITKLKHPGLLADIKRIEGQEELHVTMVKQLLAILEDKS